MIMKASRIKKNGEREDYRFISYDWLIQRLRADYALIGEKVTEAIKNGNLDTFDREYLKGQLDYIKDLISRIEK